MPRIAANLTIAALATATLAGCGAAPSIAPVTRGSVSRTPVASSAQSAAQHASRGTVAPGAPARRGFLTTEGATAVAVAPSGDQIVYAAPGRGLFAARPDGSQAHLLPGTSAIDGEPAFAPDGRSIAFVRAHSTTAGGSVLRYSLASGQTERLFDALDRPAAPAWAPNGRAIVLVAGQALLRVEPGAAPAVLARGSAIGAPTVSADGRSVVFELGQGLARTGLAGGAVQPLLVAGIHPHEPAFSPSGRTLAYAADDGLYLAQADGSQAHRVDATPDVHGLGWLVGHGASLVVAVPHGAGQSDLQAIALPQ